VRGVFYARIRHDSRIVHEAHRLQRRSRSMATCPVPGRHWVVLVPLLVAFGMSACIQRQKATDVGDPGFPFGPTTVGVQTLSYVQDVKPILDRDCLSCHSTRDARGDYSVSTYAEVLSGQTRGDAKSSLVVTGSPGGTMYQYYSGDAITKSTIVFRWLVYYNGLQSR
jgi:hypothetical protein